MKRSKFFYLKWGLYLSFATGIIAYAIIVFILKNPGMIWELEFSVSLAGLIGIGTNTIAIEMLFHPVEKTIFGRQGILPANREKIAESLANTVRERIINEETISEYLNNEDKLKRLSGKIVGVLKDWLKNSENQEKIRGFLESLIKSEGKEKLFKEIERFSEDLLVKYLSSENLRFSVIFKKIRIFFKQKREEKDPLFDKSISLLKEIINELISENSDKIANLINEIIDNFVESRKGITGIIMGLGRFFLVSEESVKKFVKDSLNDKKKVGKLGDLMEEILPDLDRILNKEKNKKRLSEIFELSKVRLFVYLKDKELKKLIEIAERKFDGIINESKEFEKFFGKLDSFIISSLEKIADYLKGYSDKGKIKELLVKSDIGGTVYRIVKTNILKQDMEEFERMMKKIMGENLAYIEVIGGFLGAFIGLGLFWKPVLLIAPLILGVFLIIEKFLTRINKKRAGI